MRNGRFAIAVFAGCFGVLVIALSGGEEPTAGPGADPLEGRWSVFEGREVKGEGYYFNAPVMAKCGNATFLDFPQRQVNFEPDHAPGSRLVPWGVYNYKFDPSGVLTLSHAGGPDIRCFLKAKCEQMRSVGHEPPSRRPFVCVFYDPEGRRAFQLFRLSEGIGSFATAPDSVMGGPVFVPFEDVLTGSWVFLAGQPTSRRELEFRLDGPAPPTAMRLTVLADNSAELKAGDTTVHFRLRQTDPAHWAIMSLPDVPCATGTIALEQAAGRVIGPNFLLTRWRIGGRAMTTVLQAEGSRRAPNVPTVRFEGAEPLNIEVLRATSPPVLKPGPRDVQPK